MLAVVTEEEAWGSFQWSRRTGQAFIPQDYSEDCGIPNQWEALCRAFDLKFMYHIC